MKLSFCCCSSCGEFLLLVFGSFPEFLVVVHSTFAQFVLVVVPYSLEGGEREGERDFG
jgi:hypothetical protein